jgi:hypothetical protein
MVKPAKRDRVSPKVNYSHNACQIKEAIGKMF